MPRNGSGAYSPPAADYPVVSGTVIESAKYNDLIADVATALTTSIASDGQTTPSANIPMGGFKITGLATGVSSTDAANVAQVLAQAVAYGPHVCEGRLTLSTGVAVTTSDVSGSTLYFTPYKGNKLALYDGSNWLVSTFSEMSIAIPTANVPYDVFCFLSSGTPTLEILVWTNDTSRATALTKQDGVYVKTGATTRRYLGTIRPAGTSCPDSLAFRYVWNYYNRVLRPMLVAEATASWNYTTNTARQANANPSNQLDFVIGVVEEPILVETCAQASNVSANVGVQTGFGLDSTTTFGALGAGLAQGEVRTLGVAGAFYVMTSSGRLYPSAGRHVIPWLEQSAATGTTTWYGSNFTGIQGELWG